jgi:DNA-binding LacI/PurR family transcriptional regulator
MNSSHRVLTSSSVAEIEADSRVQETYVRLVAEAHHLGPGAKLPKVTQLCADLGASTTTLNLALTRLEQDGLIERRHGVGIFVSPNLTKTIALICEPSFLESTGHSPLWALVIKSLRQRAQAKNETLQLHFARRMTPRTPPVPDGLARDLKQKRIQGIFALGLHHEVLSWLDSYEVPIVSFASWSRTEIHHVGYEHYSGFIEQGLEILQEKNCRNIEFWMPVITWMWPDYPDCLEARKGSVSYFSQLWESAVADKKFSRHLLRTQPGLLDCGVDMTNQRQGASLAQTVFSAPRSSWPDGILFYDDMMAHSALLTMRRMGVELGKDVTVVSQANAGSPVLDDDRNEITLLEFEPREVVEAMFDHLERLMGGEQVAQQFYIRARRRDPEARF